MPGDTEDNVTTRKAIHNNRNVSGDHFGIGIRCFVGQYSSFGPRKPLNVSELQHVRAVQEGRRKALHNQHHILHDEHPLVRYRVNPLQLSMATEIPSNSNKKKLPDIGFPTWTRSGRRGTERAATLALALLDD
jgi:hypothetical protein